MSRRTQRLLAAGIFLIAAGVGAWAWAGDGRGLDGMKKLVRVRFPKVEMLSTEALGAWLQDGSRPAPLLLDVRTPKEFAVSHLPGAQRVDPDASAAEVLPLLRKGQPVVAYCSVGYRSSALVDRLRKAGVEKIYNLEGSIFEWANEGRPLQNNGRPVQKVHPYNTTFGRMLDSERRAEP